MSNMRTTWRVQVVADTAKARSELAALAKTANRAGTSMEQTFAGVQGAPVARDLGNIGRQLNKMNVAVQRGKVGFGQLQNYWRNSGNLVRYSKQLGSANAVIQDMTDGSVRATLSMRKFSNIAASTGERVAYMNTMLQSATTNMINSAKNMQWAGRQISVGFGIPFGLAMTGASMAFLDFEEQIVRFRKVFDEEMGGIDVDTAEERVVSLANRMATELGLVRNEVLETSAVFAQMGYSIGEIERLTEQTNRLALLGEVEPTQATDLLRAYSASDYAAEFEEMTGSMEGYEEQVVNMLNAIENSTGLTLEMMTQNIAGLIPLFAQFNLELGEGEAIVAGMTEKLGGDANKAATALKTIMARVTDESKQTREEFEKVGINLTGLQERFDDDIVGLLSALGDELRRNEELIDSNLAKSRTFGNLFGVRQVSRGIAAITAIADGFDEAGNAVNDYSRALGVTTTHAENAANANREITEVAESLGKRLNRLKEQVLIEITDIGRTFLNMAMPFLEAVAQMITRFSEMSEAAQKFWIGLGGAIAVLGPALATLGVLRQVFAYTIKAISSFLPKLTIHTEEATKTRIAQDYYNESLKKFRGVAVSAEKGLMDLNSIMNNTTMKTDTMTTSMERVNNQLREYIATTSAAERTTRGLQNAMAGTAGARGVGAVGGYAKSVNANTTATSRWLPMGPYNNPLAHASGRGRRQGMYDRMFADRADKQRMYADMFDELDARDNPYFRRGSGGPMNDYSSIGMDTSTAAQRRVSRFEQRRAGRSDLRWRKGAARAGGVAMLGGMLAPGKAGDALMTVGVLSELGAIAPSITGHFAKWSKSLSNVAKSSTGIKSALARVAASGASFATAIPVAGAAIGAAGFAAYKLYQHISNAYEEAENMRNEFQLADDVASDLGLQLEKTSFRSMGNIETSEEELEQYSEAVQQIIKDAEEAERKSAGSSQRIFRNLARQWQAGGASIEEINQKLDELEATVGINIDEVDVETLTDKLREDITGALNDAIYGFGTDGDFWTSSWSFLAGREFDPRDEERINNVASTLASTFESSMGQEGGASAITDMVDSYYEMMSQKISDPAQRAEAQEAVKNAFAEMLRIPKEDYENLLNINEVLSYVATETGTSMETLENLSDQEFSNVIELFETYQANSEAMYTANKSLEERNRLAGQTVDQMRRIESSAIQAYNQFRDFSFENYGEHFYTLMQQGKSGMLEAYNAAKTFAHGLEEGSDELNYMNQIIDMIEDRLNSDYTMHVDLVFNEFMSNKAWGDRYANSPEALAYKRRQELASDDTDIDDVAEEEGEDAAESYINAFRSELDRRRQDIIDSVIDQFDEQTEAIIEGLEEQRDVEVEYLEDRKDAIDDYLDKQKEIQEAMQDQIDLAVALASGERGEAAQIQNSMRFGSVEGMAGDLKNALDQEIDAVNDSYDKRIEREEALREAKKETLEAELEGLEDIFIGTEAGWNKFLAQVGGTAEQFGATIDAGLMGGYNEAMDAIEKDARLDHMWDNADFSGLRDRIAKYITEGAEIGGDAIEDETSDSTSDGFGDGIERGMHTRRVLDAYSNRMTALAAQYTGEGIQTGIKNAERWANQTYPVLEEVTLEDGKKVMHTGGQVGGGPPKDVPAILQTGEYVIQRNAAQTLGPQMLEQLNNAHKYHSGGQVESGFLGVGSHIGSIAGQAFSERISSSMAGGLTAGSGGGPGGAGYGYTGDPMDPSRYGPRSWGEAAANTLAARSFIQSVFSENVKGAYTSVDRGDPKSDHSYGKALDVMMASLGQFAEGDAKQTGWNIAQFFQDNPEAFGTKYVIWQGLISSKSRDGLKKWRPYDGGGKYDPDNATGGHYDHVHISFLHDGGYAGSSALSLAKGGRLKANNVPATLHRGETVLRAPVAKSLEEGIAKMANSSTVGGGLTLQIDNFHGTEENIDKLASKVGDVMDRHKRKVNQRRTFS